MNIVSTMVGLSIMGAAAPSMITMSLAPFEAQKRAQNLGAAESSAVTYAANTKVQVNLLILLKDATLIKLMLLLSRSHARKVRILNMCNLLDVPSA